MQSFRTELENPLVERDIIELDKKIRLFRDGKIDPDRFRSLRLARGVYGQRQEGVQMVRIKLPHGRITSEQLSRIAQVSDEYSTGHMHITTRQDIQIHYVSLDRTPQLWAELERDSVTLREACGNTVRNITASVDAGVDPNEPFDVSPYAHAMFIFFLRNPICQDMGRKFKISFSSSDKDTALTYMHDLGFIPKIQNGKRGFKVMLGGGLGSQPRHADLLYEFLPDNKIIPLAESVLRIFDRHGERNRRMKARMKFLIKDIGLPAFLELVENENKAISSQTVDIDWGSWDKPIALGEKALNYNTSQQPSIENLEEYKLWRETNVFGQKQKGLVSIGIKVLLGNFDTDQARALAALIKDYASNELRLSLRQNILIPHVREELLPHFYNALKAMGFADAGYESTADITACPGTDTCNLGIAGSTSISKILETVLRAEYPQYVSNKDIVIKISGCMNACGQHNMAHIGFQGMSIKKGGRVAPALQVLLGGSPLGDGNGRFSDKVIKIPSKRGPQALRILLDDYGLNAKGSTFLDYYLEKGETHFYDILKPISDIENLTEDEYIDWGHTVPYVQEVGVGECASVIIDLVATLFFESEEKLDSAQDSLQKGRWADAIYHSYTAMINTAKALLLTAEKQTNTQADIINSFDEIFVETQKMPLKTNFSDVIYQINRESPSEGFAKHYLEEARYFQSLAELTRSKDLEGVEQQGV